MSDFGYDKVAITNGALPIEYKTSSLSHSELIEVQKVKALDTLGAGDVFHGAYCYYKYCENKDFPTALKCASKVAGWSTTVYGVVDGVKSFIENSRNKK